MTIELRTPLHGIVAMAKQLAIMPITPPMKEAVQIISDSGDHLVSLVDDILDFERITCNVFELERIPFSITEEVNRTMSILAPNARKKNIIFKCNLPRIRATHIGDPVRFRQVLFN